MTGVGAHYILATAGHVDHGKSALVKALTGIDPDRLPEEKARGITIDLGFAHLALTDGRGREFHVGLVDVPGHEDFVKNMVAGVGSIDLALLVVAVDDGWMPQTEEHLQILNYLGVRRAVVALTKIDLAPGGAAAALAAIRDRLQGTLLAQAPLIPVSVLSGEGLPELKAALSQVLAGTPTPADLGKPRLAIDRAFSLPGIGTVVTGSLTGGVLRKGQPVVLQPSGKITRIRSIQTHNRELEWAGPGMRTALGLSDVDVAQRTAKLDTDQGVRRGQVVTLSELGSATDVFDALIERSTRPLGRKENAPPQLRDGLKVRIHHGSGNAAAQLLLLDRKELGPGEKSIGQVRLDARMLMLAGDHFIIRDWSEQTTLAGGLVLDPQASRRGFRRPGQRSFLAQRATAPTDASTALRAELQRHRVVRQDQLLIQSNFSAVEMAGALAELRTAGAVVLAGELAADAACWNAVRVRATDLIDAHHRDHPEERGLPLSQLRSVLAGELGSDTAAEALLADLARSGFSQEGTMVRRAGHRPQLPPALQTAGNRIRSTLSAQPLDPPSRKELASTPTAQQALRYLVQASEVVELGPEVVIQAEVYKKAVEAVKALLRTNRAATVSQLRQAVGASRRIVVPLLERLDREGVTRRDGDLRSLKGP